jgi:ribonuclease P protein component
MGRRSFPAAAVRGVSASPFRPLVAEHAVAPPRSEALPKEKRLAKRREFLRVYETGRKIFSRYSVLFFAANDLPYSRIGITATKKLGKATLRNRLKRWTREVYRREREPLGLDARSLDLVVNVKPNAAGASWIDYRDDLQRALRRVAGEARS